MIPHSHIFLNDDGIILEHSEAVKHDFHLWLELLSFVLSKKSRKKIVWSYMLKLIWFNNIFFFNKIITTQRAHMIIDERSREDTYLLSITTSLISK